MKKTLLLPLGFLLVALPLRAQNLTIQGIVIRGNTSEPLPKATVELRVDDNDARVLDQTTTEDDGRFSFQNLRPARYRLTASRAGYIRLTPMTITVAADQQASDLRLPMTPTSAIYGAVYDVKSAPMVNVLVQALKASYPGGQRVLTPVQSVRTDDLGQYRLFWLAPGRYYLAAIPREGEPESTKMAQTGGFGMSVQVDGKNFVFFTSADLDPAVWDLGAMIAASRSQRDPAADYYVRVFLPGTPDEKTASAVDLRPGTEVGGADIVIRPVRAHHVRGAVLDGVTGKPSEYATLNVSDDRQDFTVPAENLNVNPSTGAFDVVLLPGAHTLTATSSAGTGSITVQVNDADLENVTISLAPQLKLSGRISVDGASPTLAELGNLRITLAGNTPRPRRGPSSYSSPIADGTFALDAGIGDFRINIAPILNVTPSPIAIRVPPALQNAYVKSIRTGNTDVLNGGLHLTSQPASPLEIILGTKRGSIQGTVANQNNQAAGDVSVVLVPDVRLRTDLYLSTSSDSFGRFRFDAVAPGDYKIFAWTEVENGIWYEPEFLREFETRGKPVRVAEGTKEEIQITSIP